MARLNDMLAKNGNLSQTLEEDNFSLEAEFINRLKDAERVSSGATLASVCYNLSLISPPQDISKLQANVAATKAAKVVLEQELIECERQIMLLERKLELEKETQAAYVAARRFYYFPVLPSDVRLLCRYNQEDETGNIIKSMKREIHKMVGWRCRCYYMPVRVTRRLQELRHVALLQEQEDLVVEVERCISKRESISMKVCSAAHAHVVVPTFFLLFCFFNAFTVLCCQGKTMPKKTETSADRKKGVNDLKGKIKDLESEAQR
jgi:hypothetical protein